MPNFGTAGTFWDLQQNYDPRTSAPLTSSVLSSNVGIDRSLMQRGAVEFDLLGTTGFGTAFELPATYAYTRDAGGRVTWQDTKFASQVPTFVAYYTYCPDGRLASAHNADGGGSRVKAEDDSSMQEPTPRSS